MRSLLFEHSKETDDFESTLENHYFPTFKQKTACHERVMLMLMLTNAKPGKDAGESGNKEDFLGAGE